MASVSAMFDDVQSTWRRLFSSMGRRYDDAGVVVFRETVESACGYSQPASGSFYCPLDRKVYVDLGVHEALPRGSRQAGDIGQTYVLTHEMGHHVQALLGVEARLRQLETQSPRVAEPLSMRLELQADCLSGVWWHAAPEYRGAGRGDIERALNAAATMGANRPTHGSPAQRVASFRRGFDAGRLSACDISGE